jgi:hypothetical protein
MKQRPWIWIIIANVIFFAAMATLVTIAVTHPQPEVPAVAAAHDP